jgi:hypothetical protein
MSQDKGFAPPPTGIDWPALVAVCERHGAPVLRTDHLGNQNLIRTLADLDAWGQR